MKTSRVAPSPAPKTTRLQELGLDVIDKLMRDFLVPLLNEMEAGRIVAWHLGLSL